MLRSMLNKGWMIVGIAFLAISYTSCTEPVETNEGDIVVDDDYYEFQSFNLQDYDIPAMISLPDETANIGASTTPEVSHTEDDIKWEIKIGTNFELIIEDYGDITDLIAVEKKELAEQDFFGVKYIIDEDDMILYERTLLVDGADDASPTVGIEHKSYHVYGQRTIGNITYELQSREDGYEKVIIELMAKSIKSFKAIEE
ncbi:MAG: hypothetical protein QNK23_00125 [Crocinitomicaceae bacterium]|nr:hypothetical protein [Crocinitomicaceae bacterium]